jgi:hypothetical protein
MNTSKKILCAVALLTPLLIVGCGGGGGNNGNVADATAVPDSAGVSAAAFLAFISSLGANDETSEPLTIGDNFAVPADEENDPQPLT